jgi:hypothetical protein
MFDIVELKSPLESAKAYRVGDCTLMVGQENGLWHISIANQKRYPSWDELKFVRYRFCPDDITMVMILPPKSDYVDLHKWCFHLWEIKDEKKSKLYIRKY